ncbi:MAG: DrmB family protein [Candidatus Odinarchaeia archaeon]
MSTQHLRRSQFILTWGPGSILEGPEGPRVIPNPELGLFWEGRRRLDVEDFSIDDDRLSQGLLEGNRIFRLPSNAELRWNENSIVYKTKKFPIWALCVDHWILHRHYQGCPLCKDPSIKYNHGAIRFVVACPAGHLDEVPWSYLVHRNNGGKCREGRNPDYFYWKGGGGSLSNIRIQCPNCKEEVGFGDVYNYPYICSGRLPHKEDPNGPPIRRKGCDQDAEIILRQASRLRIPEIVTLFTIPPRYSKLHNIMQMDRIIGIFSTRHPPENMKEFEEDLEINYRNGRIKRDTIVEIMNHTWEDIVKVREDIKKSNTGLQYDDLLTEEFEALIDAAKYGAPPRSDYDLTSEMWFEVKKEKVKNFTSRSTKIFEVTPVSKLRTVIVQKGFRRLDPTNTLVDVSFRDERNQTWYPGVDNLGEGIFIKFAENEGYYDFSGKSVKAWLEAYNSPVKEYLNNPVFRNPNKLSELHPTFVWWHSFSHQLLRALARDSGYSIASIRERVYSQMTDDGVRGGVILYTVQPGDGTMGGLISLTERFESILDRISDNLDSCPNDPLCSETIFSNGSHSGASCYGCLLVSETSCEHRNMWLDRHILMENPI